MLHILRSGRPAAANAVLQSMFAARKAVFVDLLKWEVPVLDGVYEVDQFDDEEALYLVLANRDGRHLGSARLLPTLRPHILDSLYPQLCADDPPRAAGILEVTRFCLDRALGARDRRSVRDTLVAALADFGVANGLGGYTAIAEAGWLRQIVRFGWDCRTLGPPLPIAGKLLGAVHIAIDVETPNLLARAGIIPLPALLDPDARATA